MLAFNEPDLFLWFLCDVLSQSEVIIFTTIMSVVVGMKLVSGLSGANLKLSQNIHLYDLSLEVVRVC